MSGPVHWWFGLAETQWYTLECCGYSASLSAMQKQKQMWRWSGQNWDFWAVANSTAVWSATWKTTGWQTKEPFFGNMNLGTSHGCWLKSGTLLWMPMGRGGSLLRLTGIELLISTAQTTKARKTCDSGQKLTYLSHNRWDHVSQSVTSPAPGRLAMSDLCTSLRIINAASPLSILFQVIG